MARSHSPALFFAVTLAGACYSWPKPVDTASTGAPEAEAPCAVTVLCGDDAVLAIDCHGEEQYRVACGNDAHCEDGSCEPDERTPPGEEETGIDDTGEEPCDPEWETFCDGDEVWIRDEAECGEPDQFVQSCDQDCDNGRCENEDPENPSDELVCLCAGDGVWCYASGSGEFFELTECPHGCVTDDRGDPVCDDDPCPDDRAGYTCLGDDSYYVDSCGVATSLAEACEQGCDDTSGACRAMDTAAWTPSDLNNLYVTERLSSGSDFSGNGPACDATVELIASTTEVTAVWTLDCIETDADWTRLYGEGEVVLYNAPSGWEIYDAHAAGSSATSSACSYTDTDHSLDRCDVSGTSVVDYFMIQGDTSNEECCGSSGDTYMNVYFSELEVDLVQD